MACRNVFVILFALPLGYHFIKSINTKYVFEWKRDANTKIVIETIQNCKSVRNPKSVVSYWYLSPSLKYYAEKTQGQIEVIIDNEYTILGDFIYCYKEDLNKISNLQLYEIQSDFPDTQTVLLAKKQ